MTKISLVTPNVGELNTVAEPKVTTALKEVEKFLNEKNIETTDNLKAGGITEASLSTALQEKLTTRLGFVLEKKNESFTAEGEKFYEQEKNGATVTLPTPTANRMIGVICAPAIAGCKVKTFGGQIFGEFFGEGKGQSVIELLSAQHVILLADGANWFIIAGEPKRVATYTNAVRTKAEAEAGIEPSATRSAWVNLVNQEAAASTITVGGEAAGALEAVSGASCSIFVSAGLKWKATVKVATYTLLL